MSRATECRTAAGRASEAIRQIKTRREFGRSFDDCFEMGDGDEVVRIIRARAASDPQLTELLNRRGFGVWLEPDYLDQHYTSDRQTSLFDEAPHA